MSIRFPVTGPVVDIPDVRRVPAAWVSELLAPVMAVPLDVVILQDTEIITNCPCPDPIVVKPSGGIRTAFPFSSAHPN